MRYVAWIIPNGEAGRFRDPTLPDRLPLTIPVALTREDPVCSSREENDRWLFGETICSEYWDDRNPSGAYG